MSALAIEAEALTRDFQSVRAVDGLTLAVPRGAVFGFLGPNGAGKTTTIRLLLGLLKPTGGRAEVLGWDTRRNAGEIRARTGALLEHDGLYPCRRCLSRCVHGEELRQDDKGAPSQVTPCRRARNALTRGPVRPIVAAFAAGLPNRETAGRQDSREWGRPPGPRTGTRIDVNGGSFMM